MRSRLTDRARDDARRRAKRVGARRSEDAEGVRWPRGQAQAGFGFAGRSPGAGRARPDLVVHVPFCGAAPARPKDGFLVPRRHGIRRPSRDQRTAQQGSLVTYLPRGIAGHRTRWSHLGEIARKGRALPPGTSRHGGNRAKALAGRGVMRSCVAHFAVPVVSLASRRCPGPQGRCPCACRSRNRRPVTGRNYACGRSDRSP